MQRILGIGAGRIVSGPLPPQIPYILNSLFNDVFERNAIHRFTLNKPQQNTYHHVSELINTLYSLRNTALDWRGF